MYFCPCSCNDPLDPETEENTLVALPRNLSYVQDSYLDRYSVSARFVHNPKIERTIQHQQSQERWANVEDETVGLLAAIRAEDFPVRCESHYEPAVASSGLHRSSGKVDTSDTYLVYSKETVNNNTTGSWLTSPQPSSFSASSLFEPASRVASRLSSLLHSPPNESMDFARGDPGSSVDGDPEDRGQEEEAPLVKKATVTLECPDSLGEEMDRGDDLCFSPQALSSNFDSSCEDEEEQCNILQEKENDVESDSISGEKTVLQEETLLKSFGIGGKTRFPKPDDVKNSENNGIGILYGSPDSEGLSEEGVFVNMDDFDSTTEKSTTVSETSDDTCVSADSMFLSPDEGELEDEVEPDSQAPVRKMSLEEAISRAASDLSRLSFEEDDDDPYVVDSRLTLRTVGRGSPIRITSGLKIQITDQTELGSQTHFSGSPSALSESPIYPEHEFNFSRVELRKSSSLKTNKTPPGTPHRKKVVRFADAMGLDLESVRHVLNMESPPKIPASAMADLRPGLSEDRKEIGSKYLCLCFPQPGAADNFVQKVLSQKVSLENAVITDLTITGFVRVANISFHKNVRVRYTYNSWATFHDIAASYVLNSCDGPTDRFSFSIVAPAFFGPGSRLEFALSYNAGGAEFWDSNNGVNYVFECFAKSVPTESELAWLHFL